MYSVCNIPVYYDQGIPTTKEVSKLGGVASGSHDMIGWSLQAFKLLNDGSRYLPT